MIFRPYDRLEAVIYAHRWAYSHNPSFYDYEELGGDCTNFASQCIYAGTGIMNFTPTYGWYYIDPDDKAVDGRGVSAELSGAAGALTGAGGAGNAGAVPRPAGRCDPAEL